MRALVELVQDDAAVKFFEVKGNPWVNPIMLMFRASFRARSMVSSLYLSCKETLKLLHSVISQRIRCFAELHYTPACLRDFAIDITLIS